MIAREYPGCCDFTRFQAFCGGWCHDFVVMKWVRVVIFSAPIFFNPCSSRKVASPCFSTIIGGIVGLVGAKRRILGVMY